MTPTIERIQRKLEALRRHYEATSNPLFVWAAIKELFTRCDAAPLPRWISDYLQQAARTLIDLGEGVDRSQQPALPKEGFTTDADMLAFFGALREYEARVTVDDAKVVEQAMRVLGFVTRQNHNVFREYRAILREQGDAEIVAIRFTKHLHERLRAGEVATQTSFVASEAEAAGRETRTVEKRLEKVRKSLKRGKLEPDPYGPEASRRLRTRLGGNQ